MEILEIVKGALAQPNCVDLSSQLKKSAPLFVFTILDHPLLGEVANMVRFLCHANHAVARR